MLVKEKTKILKAFKKLKMLIHPNYNSNENKDTETAFKSKY
jgi:curved DNA-binding protein CbpA